MQIYFANVYGDTIERDMQISLPYAWVEEGEEDYAFSRGFYRTYGDFDCNHYFEDFFAQGRAVWLQSRLSRIDVGRFRAEPDDRRVARKYGAELRYDVMASADLGEFERSELGRIFYRYLEARGYDPYYDEATRLSYEEYLRDYVLSPVRERSIVFIYFRDELVAFSSFEQFRESVFGSQFAWDYGEPRLSLGNLHISYMVDLARSAGLRYLYLGHSYGRSCIYKAKFPGFEFWTGYKWVDDPDKYRQICQADESVVDLDSLEKRVHSMFGDPWN